jgi:hypothetical protein
MVFAGNITIKSRAIFEAREKPFLIKYLMVKTRGIRRPDAAEREGPAILLQKQLVERIFRPGGRGTVATNVSARAGK